MTSLCHGHIVVLPLTDLSIKLLEYRSKLNQKAKIEQKLLNKKRDNTVHVHLVKLFLVIVCHYIYATKNIRYWITGLYRAYSFL